MTDRIRLLVLFGGQSAEHDVSCSTARHVLEAANKDRYEIEPIGISRTGEWAIATSAAAALAGDASDLPLALEPTGRSVAPTEAIDATGDTLTVALPLLHGPMGEDGTVQGLLELAGIPYVGTGVLGSALCMDKVMAKEVAAQHGIPQARYRALHVDDLNAASIDRIGEDLGYPVFVKPANMGSSVGVSKALTIDQLTSSLADAATYDEWLVVEEAVVAREIEVAVIGNRELRASLPGEIVPGDDFYSYDDKYHDGIAETLVPADLDEAAIAEVQGLATKAAAALRVEGLARVDFFFEEAGRGFLLNEINTMPGFTPISMYPKLWAASGLAYTELIDELVDLAVARHRRRNLHRRVDI